MIEEYFANNDFLKTRIVRNTFYGILERGIEFMLKFLKNDFKN